MSHFRPFYRNNYRPYNRSSHNSGSRPHQLSTHMPFDPICCASIFPNLLPIVENLDFSKCLMSYLSTITPSIDETQVITSLLSKVIECFDCITLSPGKLNQVHIEETRPVGSLKKGTMLTGNCIADLVIVLRELPSFTIISSLYNLLQDEFTLKEAAAFHEDQLKIEKKAYGFDFSYMGSTIRIAFTSNFQNFKYIQSDVHVSRSDQSIALAAISHARWAEENAAQPNVKALIRIFKDFRRRFTGFQYLNPWHIDLLCFYMVMQNPTNQPLSVPIAFRRTLQLLSAGLFLPGSSGFLDPCETHNRRIHLTLSAREQDSLCCMAQTMCRILSSPKYPVLFEASNSNSFITSNELATLANMKPGFLIHASEPIFSEPIDEVGDSKVPVKDVTS